MSNFKFSKNSNDELVIYQHRMDEEINIENYDELMELLTYLEKEKENFETRKLNSLLSEKAKTIKEIENMEREIKRIEEHLKNEKTNLFLINEKLKKFQE